MTSKHLVAVALLACVCLGVATVYVWRGMQTVQTEENAQAGNVFSISELMANPENFENENVRIKGTITRIYTKFMIRDDTGEISIEDFEEGLFYNRGEDVIVSGISQCAPYYSWPNHIHGKNVENVGEEQPTGLVKISEVIGS